MLPQNWDSSDVFLFSLNQTLCKEMKWSLTPNKFSNPGTQSPSAMLFTASLGIPESLALGLTPLSAFPWTTSVHHHKAQGMVIDQVACHRFSVQTLSKHLG